MQSNPVYEMFNNQQRGTVSASSENQPIGWSVSSSENQQIGRSVSSENGYSFVSPRQNGTTQRSSTELKCGKYRAKASTMLVSIVLGVSTLALVAICFLLGFQHSPLTKSSEGDANIEMIQQEIENLKQLLNNQHSMSNTSQMNGSKCFIVCVF